MWWASSNVYNDRILAIGYESTTAFVNPFIQYSDIVKTIELPNCVFFGSCRALYSLSLLSLPNARFVSFGDQCSNLSIVNFPNAYNINAYFGSVSFQYNSYTLCIAPNVRTLSIVMSAAYYNRLSLDVYPKLLFYRGTLSNTIDSTVFPIIRHAYIMSFSDCTLSYLTTVTGSLFLTNVSCPKLVYASNLFIHSSASVPVLASCNYMRLLNCVDMTFPRLYIASITSDCAIISLPRAYHISLYNNSTLSKLIITNSFIVKFGALSYVGLYESHPDGTYASIYVRSSLISTYQTIASLSSIYDRFVAIETLPISFDIANETFNTMWGTTWGDWISSPENTNYQIVDNSIYTLDGTRFIYGVTPLSKITESGIQYSLSLI